MTFNNVELTQESILAAHKRCIDLAERCIVAAEAGEWFVNDVPAYAKSQRAYYIQTGQDRALLP